MSKLVCGKCEAVHEIDGDHCPRCGADKSQVYDFRNSDEYLKAQVPRVLEERRSLGLEGLTGGLEYVVINTEPENLDRAAAELVSRTGHDVSLAFEDAAQRAIVLSNSGSAGIMVRSRLTGNNPFRTFNDNPRSRHLPNTRLETLVFRIEDIERYFKIQRSRGVRFQTEGIQSFDNYLYIETLPSGYTGNALGFIEWTGRRGDLMSSGRRESSPELSTISSGFRENIGRLDHMATRVHAMERDRAIIEFMELTDYVFDFAIYVKVFNSITNVARLAPDEFAMVFTSGIRPFVSEEVSGPTEKFIVNYGKRVHHMAFRTERIEETFAGLKDDGQEFLIDLVGSEQEGLKQTFTEASDYTLLVNEYIHRYGDFTGFFSKSNVTHLTGSTDSQ